MKINYNKLWKLMIDKKYTKVRLIKEAKITTNVMAKMGREEEVRLSSLIKICDVFDCKIDDIIDYSKEYRREIVK